MTDLNCHFCLSSSKTKLVSHVSIVFNKLVSHVSIVFNKLVSHVSILFNKLVSHVSILFNKCCEQLLFKANGAIFSAILLQEQVTFDEIMMSALC